MEIVETIEIGIDYSPIQIRLIQEIETHGPQMRHDLVKLINVPRTTVYDNLTGLMNRGILYKYSVPTNRRGRPLVYFAVRKNVSVSITDHANEKMKNRFFKH